MRTRQRFDGDSGHADAAMRQKARWIAGIALAGWDHLGWPGTRHSALAAQPGQMDAKQQALMETLLERLAAEAGPAAPQPAADARLPDALARLDAALRQRPNDAELHGLRGEVLFALGRTADARTALAESLRGQGQNVKRLILLAEASEKLGDRARALAVAKSLAADPGQLDAGQKKRVKDLLLRLR